MDNNFSNHTIRDTSDDISLKKIVAKMWPNKKFILLCTGAFFLMGLFVAFTSPVSYTASCTLVPQLGDRKSSSLSGLASIVGVNLGSSMSNESLSPAVYPQIINSVPFCKEIMKTPIVVKKSNYETISLYDYYTDENYRSTNILESVKKYTIGLPSLLHSAIKSKKSPDVYNDTIKGEIVKLNKKERFVIRNIQQSIEYQSNPKDGYIILGFSFSEPEPTAIIAQNMYSTLEKYVKSYKTEKQLENLLFVEENYEKARESFMEKQDALAKFQDANRDLTSSMARTMERRLSNEYEIAYTVYNELAKQLEQTKISVKESTPILTVINPVIVPHHKSAPRKSLVIFAFLFFGIIVSISWVLLKPFLQDIINELKENDK